MKKIILGCILLAVVAGLAVDGYLWMRRPQVIVMSDGTKVTYLGCSYGRHHVPPRVKLPGGGYRRANISIDSTNDTLVVWMEAQTKPNQWPNYNLLVYDLAHTACVSTWTRNSSQVRNGVQLQGFELDAYPRWDRKLALRLMSWGAGGQRTSKEQIVISNPARRGPFEKWTPEAIPVTHSDGDLDVTLTKLTYGVRGFGGGNIPPNDPAKKAVATVFHTVQNGVVVTNWQPVRIETSDASGNTVANSSWSNSRESNGDADMNYQWGLWPEQTPWKLRVEMSRTSGFNDNELWTVQQVPLNRGSQQDLWNYANRNSRADTPFAETTLNGIHLKLYPAVLFTDQNWGDGRNHGGFRVFADPEPEGIRMTILKVTDEQGRPLEYWDGGSGGGNYTFQLPNLRNTKSLNLTVALHKSRFVEFTVNPEKP